VWGGGEPPRVAFLEYVDDQSGAILALRVIAPGETVGFDATNLTPSLTAVPLDRVRVRYTGVEGVRSDVYTFSQDLAHFRDQLRLFATPFELSVGDALGEYVDCEPDGAHRLAWDGSDDPLESELWSTTFWGGLGSPEPCGEGAEPTGVGSVKSAVVYDRGTCAFIIDDLQVRVRDRTRRTWNELASVVRDIPTLGLSNLPISRDRHRTETYVEIDGRTNETRGGFVFASALEVDLPFGFNNLKVAAGYDFPFRMNAEGMIEAPAEGLNLIVTGGGIFGDSITNNVVQFIVTDEIQSRLGDVTDELQDEQWIDAGDLVDIAEPLCTPLNPLPPVEQCATLRPPLRIVTGLGLSNMRAEGLVEENEVDETTLLDNYDQANNWRCRESRCQLRVQAKRLNVYPDAVELVFFDEPEPALTGYALFVAAHAAEGNDRRLALRALCRRRHDSLPVEGDGLAERFAGWGMDPCTGCNYFNECIAADCEGCSECICGECEE
jgi:hypothetical protein